MTHLRNCHQNRALGMVRHLAQASGLSLKSSERKDVKRGAIERKGGCREMGASEPRL